MIRIHPTVDVAASVSIGEGTSIWHHSQVREGVHIGEQCILGKNVYVDFEVQIGDRVKIQNNCSIYHGVTLENGVFIGPHVVLTNDLYPRVINPDGSLKGDADWEVRPMRISYGASIGARSVVLPGVTVGRFAMVGAGAVITRDVPDYAVVVGTPARRIGYACVCGRRLQPAGDGLLCVFCGQHYSDPPGL